jgi:hypothetical protein
MTGGVSWDDEALVAVHEALSEPEANIVKGILEEAGIPAMLQSLQVPMYDGVMSMFHGHWGNVVVRQEDYERALDVIQAARTDEIED